MEISPDIHRIDGVRGANCYLVVRESRMLLIDTGMPGNARRVMNYVKGMGKNPSGIGYVILTHADIDHIGSAAEMKKMTGAKLAIHADDAPILEGKRGFKAVRGPLGLLFRLMVRMMRFQPVEPDIVLAADSEVDGFTIIHTPGHTRGSISVYAPGKVIFVGDALRSDSRGNPVPPSRALSLDRVQASASVAAISRLQFDMCLTGHGAPVIGDASAKVRDLVTRLK